MRKSVMYGQQCQNYKVKTRCENKAEGTLDNISVCRDCADVYRSDMERLFLEEEVSAFLPFIWQSEIASRNTYAVLGEWKS